MMAKRDYVIDELMVDGFIDRTGKRILLKETDDTGQTDLLFELDSEQSLTIKNVDKKNTNLMFFQTTKTKSMFKRVDHIVFENVGDNIWRVHLVEMKSGVGSKTWMETKGKFRASYLLVQGLAAMLEMQIEEVCMYTSYESCDFELSDTMPVERRVLVGEKHVKIDDEWNGKNFVLNFGERIKFKHNAIKVVRNQDGILTGKYTC